MKDFKISQLNDIYGSLLTQRQSLILRDYFDFDLSYGEIAQTYGITRQAVGQIIEGSSKQLEGLEEKLRLSEVLIELRLLKDELGSLQPSHRLDKIISLIGSKPYN